MRVAIDDELGVGRATFVAEGFEVRCQWKYCSGL